MERVRSFFLSKVFLIPLALVFFYTLMGFVFAPLALRWYVPKAARDRLNAQATIGKVRVNPFYLSLEANAFRLNDPHGEALAGFDRLFLDFEVRGLFRWTVAFREMRLEKPSLHVVIEPDGALNLAALAPASPKPEASERSESDPFGLVLHHIALVDGEVTLTDRRQSTPANLSVQNIDLDLRALSTLRNQNGTYGLTARTGDDETIRWEGDITLAPFHSTGRLTCSGVRVSTLWEFFRNRLGLDSPSGTLEVSTDYRFDTGATPVRLTLDNVRVGLSGVALKLADGKKPFFDVQKIEAASARVDLAARTLQVATLLVEEGTLDLRIDGDGRSNLERIVLGPMAQACKKGESPEEGAATEPPPADGPPWMIALEALEIKNIALGFEDFSRNVPLAAGIAGMSIRTGVGIEAGADTKIVLHKVSTELKDLRIGGVKAPPLFRAQTVTVEGGEVDTRARKVSVERLALSDGHADASRDAQGRINWEQVLAAGPSNGSATKPGARSERAWAFLLKTIELSGFRSALSDHAAAADKPLYNLHTLSARLSDVDGTSPMAVEANFEVEQGGKVAVSGKVDPSSKAVEAKVNVAGLVLSPLQPYLEPHVTLTLQSAALSTEGALRYNMPQAGANLTYVGSLGVDGLSFTQPGSQETYLGWRAMQIPQLELTLAPNALQIGEVRLREPVGHLIIAEDRTVNLSKLMKEQPGQANPPAPPLQSVGTRANRASTAPRNVKESEGSFPFKIGRLRVEEGKLFFADYSLKPQFMARIHGLKGTVSRFSSARRSTTDIQLDGRVDQYGMARITGALDLNDFKRLTDVSLAFRNVEMTSLTPYSGKFAGRKIKSGKISADLKYRIQNTKLAGDNKIIVDKLVLGERVDSPEAVNLPLDLAVALLSDSNGRIDIGLPVSGDLDDPQFSLGPLVWKALVNFLTKIVTAPFRAMGALLGGGGEAFEAVVFDAGKAELLPPEKEKLKKLAGVLQKRPQLKLAVQGRYSPEEDGMEFKRLSIRRAVAARMEAALGPDEDPGPLDLSDSKVRKALEKMFAERFGESSLDEVERAVEAGTLKPRVDEAAPARPDQKKRQGITHRVLDRVKIYRVVPGMHSPEEAQLMAGELYARLVESEPVSEESLSKLALARREAIHAELQAAGGVPQARLLTRDPEAQPGDTGLAANLSLDAGPAL